MVKNDSKEVERGKCMRESDGKLCFSEKENGKVWKDYVTRIMRKENDLCHDVEGDAVVGPVVCVSREEVVQALNKMITGKANTLSNVSLKLIAVSVEV